MPPESLDRIWRGIEGVVFDMDGLLADTEPIHHRASNTVLARLGEHLSEEENKRFIGLGERPFWEIMKRERGLEPDVEELARRRGAAFIEILRDGGLEPMPGAVSLLDSCLAGGYPLALASSTPRPLIDAVLHAAGLARYFPVRVSGQDPEVKVGKPAPDVYLRAASLIGVPPARCLAFEDSQLGVRAARAAGMRCVAVPNALTRHFDFGAADAIADSLEAVPRPARI